MRVQYEVVLDEIVDVQIRAMRQSKVVSRWRWQGMIMTALLAGVVLFAIIPDTVGVRLVYGIVGVIAGALLYPWVYRRILRRRLQKYVREQLGTEGPGSFAVELTPEGIWTKLRNTQIIFDWINVEEIRDLPDSVEILMRDGGLVVVRKRGFDGLDQVRQFIELVNQHTKRAQASRTSTRC